MDNPYAQFIKPQSANPYTQFVKPTDAPRTSLLHQFGSGANEFIASVLDLPVTALSALSELVGGNPIPGDYRFKRLFESGGLIAPPQTGLGSEMARVAGGMTAGTLTMLMGMGGAAAAAPGAATAGGATQVTSGVVNAILPRSAYQLAADTGVAATSGAGMVLGENVGTGVAQQVGASPEVGGAVGELTGALIGGGISPMGIAGKAARFALPGALKGFAGEGANVYANKQVSGLLKESLGTPTAEANLTRAGQVEEIIPGFKPTLAESSGSKNLIHGQEYIQQQASGAKLESLVERRLQNERAIALARTATLPDGKDWEWAVDTLTGRYNSLRESIKADATADAARLPTAVSEATGETLRTRYMALKQDVSKSFTDRANAFKLSEADVTVAFKEYANNLIANLRTGSVMELKEDMVPEVSKRIQMVLTKLEKGEVDQVKFSDLKLLRERLGDALRDNLKGANPNQNYARQLYLAKESLDEVIKTLPLGAEYKQFVNDYFNQYVQRFENNVVYKVKQRDGHGFYVTPDEQVAGLFTDGSFSSAQQFKTAFGDDIESMTAFQNSLLDSFSNSAVKAGVVDTAAAQSWIKNHSGLFRVFPEMRVTPEALLGRAQVLNQLTTQIEDSALGKVIRGVEGGSGNPEAMIKRALYNSQTRTELLKEATRDPDIAAALRRKLFEFAPEDATLAGYLSNPLVKGVLDETHRRTLMAIFDANKMLARVSGPMGQMPRFQPLGVIQERLGVKIPQAASRLFAVSSGRTSERFVLTEAAARLFNKMGIEQADLLLEKALYNPAVARDTLYAMRQTISVDVSSSVLRAIMRPWFVYYGLEAPLAPKRPDRRK